MKIFLKQKLSFNLAKYSTKYSPEKGNIPQQSEHHSREKIDQRSGLKKGWKMVLSPERAFFRLAEKKEKKYENEESKSTEVKNLRFLKSWFHAFA